MKLTHEINNLNILGSSSKFFRKKSENIDLNV